MFTLRASVAFGCLVLTACGMTPHKTDSRVAPAPPPSSEAATAAASPASVSASPAAPALPVVAPAPTQATPTAIPSPPPKPVSKAATTIAPTAVKSTAPAAAKVAVPAKSAASAQTAATQNSANASNAVLVGHVQLVVGAGQSVDAEEVADAVAYFVPNAGAPHPKPGRFQIYTRDKVFEPSSLVVPLGSVVSFPNQDEILHNVFSATPGADFDLGLYGEGKTGDATFRKAGLVVVNCNVHHAMQASILVVDTPYFAHVAKNGDFRLNGLPSGAGKLMLWHPRGVIQTLDIASITDNALSMQLTVTKPRVVAHLNKERKQYQPSRD